MNALHAHRDELDAAPLAADVDADRFGAYRGYAELVDRWIATGARAEIVGHSVAGSPLFALELGNPDATRVSAIMAGIHPIEWIGVETMLALLDRLAADPPADRRVIAFPLVNIDGYRRVESNQRAGRARWVRSNDNGVDLNRNWPANFRAGGRGLLAGYNRGGPYPLSEPEVAAVVHTLDAVHAHHFIDVALSLHSIGRMLLYPYGGRWKPPAGVDRMTRAAAAINRRMARPYTIKQSSHWVPGAFAHGMELDYLHDRYGATALLVECSRGGASARRPRSLVSPFAWFNPPNPQRVASDLAEALEPFVRGSD